MKIDEFKIEMEKTLIDEENEKIDRYAIKKIANNLWCINGEDIYDGDTHTLFIETENPVEVIAKLYKRTLNKSSHDIIFVPEANLMFDHGYYIINYENIKSNPQLFLVRLYCRPIRDVTIYNKYINPEP